MRSLIGENQVNDADFLSEEEFSVASGTITQYINVVSGTISQQIEDTVLSMYDYIDEAVLSGSGITSHESIYNHTNYNTAYSHSQAPHAPSNAQKNSDITKAEIEAKLTGEISSHEHSAIPSALFNLATGARVCCDTYVCGPYIAVQNSPNANGDVTYTANGTGYPVLDHNFVIRHINNGPDQILSVAASFGYVDVTLATNSNGDVTSTAVDVTTAVNGYFWATLFCSAAYEGNGSGIVSVGDVYFSNEGPDVPGRGLDAVDGVSLNTSDYILLINNDHHTGLWRKSGTQTWARLGTEDTDKVPKIIKVTEGTVYGGTYWATGEDPQWMGAGVEPSSIATLIQREENINLARNILEPTGFPNTTDSTVSFNEGTRTFSIAPVSSEFYYYIAGKKYTHTTQKTVIISDIEGIHYICFDGATLTATQDPTNFTTHKAAVAVVYWDATNKKLVGLAEERHGFLMDGTTHKFLHDVLGARYSSGLGLGNITIGDGSLDTHAQLSVGDGAIWDEDLYHTITDGSPQDLAPIAQIPVIYKTGASGYWRLNPTSNFPLKPFVGGSGLAAINEYTGGVWTQTEVTSNNYFLVHLFAVNGTTIKIVSVQGEKQYSNITTAREGATTEIFDITSKGLPTKEFVPIATVIYQTKTSFANAAKSRIVLTDGGGQYIDWRTTKATGYAGPTVSDHGQLAGLADNDHPQYSLTSHTHTLDSNSDVDAPNPMIDQFLKYNGSSWIPGEIGASGGSGVTYFLDSAVSDITDYKTFTLVPPEHVESTETITVNSSEGMKLIRAYASEAFGRSILDGGIWKCIVYGSVTGNDTDPVMIHMKIYSRATDTTETLLYECMCGEWTNTTPTEIGCERLEPSFVVDPTDRLVIKFYTQTAHATDVTVTFYLEGNERATRIQSPISVKHNQLEGLQGGTSSERYHLTQAELAVVQNASPTDWDTAYSHSQATHAPSDAQKNSDITKSEIEAVLTGDVSSHNHPGEIHAVSGHFHCSVNSSTFTTETITVPFDSITLDDSNPTRFSINNGELTCLVSGKYLLCYTVTTDQSATSARSIGTVWVEGDPGGLGSWSELDNTRGFTYCRDYINGRGSTSLQAPFFANAGDKFRMRVARDSGTGTMYVYATGTHGMFLEIPYEGPQGLPGAKWYNQAGAPAPGLGIDGDYSLDTTNGDVYEKISGTWTYVGSIKGATGDIGNHESTYNHTNYNTAYNHSQATHAPSNAQKNSDITKAEIEAKLTGEISSHSHPAGVSAIFGTRYHYGMSWAQSNTNATTPQLKLRTTSPVVPSGVYRVSWYYESGASATNSSFLSYVAINGTPVNSVSIELSDNTDWVSRSGFSIIDMALGPSGSTITLDLYYYSESASMTVSVRAAILEMWRLS